MPMLCKVLLAAITILLSIAFPSAAADGNLDSIRSDVRTSPPEPPTSPPPAPSEEPRRGSDGNQINIPDDTKRDAIVAGLAIGAFAVASPYWLPRALLHDDGSEALFPKFPYDNTSGYLVSEAWLSEFTAQKVLAETLAEGTASQSTPWNGPGETVSTGDSLIALSLDPSARRWAGQFRADYADEFNRLTSIGGQLILETTSRWGIDASAQHLRERLPGDNFDHLTLGDCNLVYRFAQSPRAQMRMGLGANWLNDSSRTDLGFNFTYGGDFFPRKPWVLSSAIDWGTLGHAGLFRFRTTAGVILDRFETYVGYEYLDIGTTQGNFVIGGIRVWF